MGLQRRLALQLVLVAGCASDERAELGSETGSGPDGSAGETEAELDVPADTRTCWPPPGVSGSPQTIGDAVALINALPRPVTIACVLESLDRPLQVELTNSIFSAQPAGGPEDPRIFIFSGDLILSVVPAGDGSKLLEFGQLIDELRSIKGELAFPIEAELSEAAPYEKVIYAEGVTVCGFCHGAEARVAVGEGLSAFASSALAPDPRTLVELSELEASAEACEGSSERCEILRALFNHGPVLHRPFPEHLPTIFGP